MRRTEIWFSCCTWGCEFDLNTADIDISHTGFIKRGLAVIKAKYLVHRHRNNNPDHDPYINIKHID